MNDSVSISNDLQEPEPFGPWSPQLRPLSRRSLLGLGAGLVWTLTGSWSAGRWPEPTSSRPRIDLPGETAAPAPAAAARPAAAPEAEPPAVPRQQRIRYVRRADWGGLEPATNHRPLHRVTRITVHHTGADTRSLGASDLQTVQRIESYHRDERGWACIGYHYLIGFDGTIYEGRPVQLQGAHVLDHNEGNVGIACIGAFDCELPPEPQLASLRRLTDAIRDKAGLPRSAVFGHRDLSPSTCPGDALYAWLQEHLFGPAFG